MKRDIGPWSENLDLRHIPGLFARSYFGKTPGVFVRQVNESSARIGLLSARTGYESPSRPYLVPRSASLVITKTLTLQTSGAKYFYKTNDHTMEWTRGEVNLTPVSLVFATNRSKVDNTARMRFISRASAGVDTYPILAEARKTGKGIASNATSLAGILNKAYSKAKPVTWRRKRDTAGLLKQSSDRWLELQYQYKPVVNDIKNGLIALDDLSYFTSKKCEGNGKSDERKRYVLNRHICNLSAPNASGTFGIVTTSGDVNFTYDSKLGATWAPSPGVSTYRALKVQWQDVAPAIYELFPYSFVADYFSNLQEVIMGHSFDFTVWTNLWSSRFSRIDGTFTSVPQAPNGNYLRVDGSDATSTLTSVTFNRGPAAQSNFIPKLQLSLPSLAQSANLIALAASRVLHVPKTWVRV